MARPQPEVSRDITLADLERSISSLKPLYGWIKGLVGIAVAIGLWGYRNELRLRDIEAWQEQRKQPIERYYEEREALAGQLADLNARLKNVETAFAAIDGKLDRLLTR